ncbi:unnamed protein product [Rhizophagus irregularis]|uniref:Methyl-CpG-binding domain protein 4 n=1 Tax=Rhizophagus irregularis TaxID=588596 RepID=A0A915YPM6_9GLOM|nr:unnamed protein product [Rhizophagus irregularis]CAB5204908.1 unnamed protein product [Rhizophagus irregularis]CAB5307782.1 unnamed protein product [Rhizophagus irregularis]
MKRKSEIVKTETKSPYFNSSISSINGENKNNAPFKDALNKDITKDIFDTLLTNKSETKSKIRDITSIKRTGKISKYFRSIKKGFTKNASTYSAKHIKFSEEEAFLFMNNLSNIDIDLKVDSEATEGSISEIEYPSEKDLNFNFEESKSGGGSRLPTMEEAKKAASIEINYVPKFIPMPSPFNLVQETLYYDPWKLLIATMFLNRTRGSQALPIMWKFLEEYPTPQKAVLADVHTLADLLRPLGLQNSRAERIIKFSYAYLLNSNFKTPKNLFGMGKYAEDSWKLFCEKDDNWMEEYGLEPEDKILQLYVNWRRHQYKISRVKEEERDLGLNSPNNIVKKYYHFLRKSNNTQ